MTNRSRVVSALLAALGLVSACDRDVTEPTDPSARSAPTATPNISSRYIVVFKNGTPDPVGVARTMGSVPGSSIRHVFQHALQGFTGTLSPATVTALRKDPRVKYVEAVQPVILPAVTQTQAPIGLDRIDQISRPLSTTYRYGPTGSGVRIYLIDSGIRTAHQDFGGRASVGKDFRPEDGQNGQDCFGHGTAAASLIGGSRYGVAKMVSLVALRIANCIGNGDSGDLVAAFDWVVANGIRPGVVHSAGVVANGSGAVDDAAERAMADGFTVVAPANNANANACQVSPARVPGVITVGNIDPRTDVRSSTSNFGTCLDLFAPGVGISAAWKGSNTDSTSSFSGTSAAAPHASGVAALYLQNNQAASPTIVAIAQTTAASRNVLSGIGAGSPNLLLNSIGGSMAVTVGGPTSVTTATPKTWTAAVTGGIGAYTYRWEVWLVSSGQRLPQSGTGASVSITPQGSWGLFYVEAYVRSGGSPEQNGFRAVNNQIPGGCTFC